jgi:acyl-CoA thioesterase FadM
MRPVALAELAARADVTELQRGLELTVDPGWVVAGEDRVSYTTLLRLVECCRERHWSQDVAPADTGGSLDSITRSVEAEFMRPLPAASRARITYRVTRCGRTSYALAFEVAEASSREPCAEVRLVCVFYDAAKRAAVMPPPEVSARLQALRSESGLP